MLGKVTKSLSVEGDYNYLKVDWIMACTIGGYDESAKKLRWNDIRTLKEAKLDPVARCSNKQAQYLSEHLLPRTGDRFWTFIIVLVTCIVFLKYYRLVLKRENDFKKTPLQSIFENLVFVSSRE